MGGVGRRKEERDRQTDGQTNGRTDREQGAHAHPHPHDSRARLTEADGEEDGAHKIEARDVDAAVL